MWLACGIVGWQGPSLTGTICSEDRQISRSRSHIYCRHTPILLIFPHAPQKQPPVAELSRFGPESLLLCATLHRRYQGNWQWLKICSIIEPRPVWLTGLGSPHFESDPSSEAISDIQFVLKLPLRVSQGPDLINIFYGELLDVAGSASGPLLIIVRAHYGWLCDSEAWQWFMNALVSETQTGKEVTGVQWDRESWFSRGLGLIVQFHWQLSHASLRLIRSDSCKRVTMLHWIEFVSFTVLSITYQRNEPHCK